MYGGALKSPDSPDDYIFEQISHGKDNYYLVEMPAAYDLRKYMKPARSQGNRNTCGAHAAASIKEIQEAMDCNFSEYMSPEFIYFHRENKPSSGMYGRNVFQILQQIGSVPESMYPHNGDDAPEPTARHYEVAAKFKIRHFARVTTANGLKRAILEVGPCFMQLPLYKNRPYFWRRGDGEETPLSGHAVAVVGYNEDGFLLKNSWGSKWNGDGCVIFPYVDWPTMWECWVAVDEKTGDVPETEARPEPERSVICTII